MHRQNSKRYWIWLWPWPVSVLLAAPGTVVDYRHVTEENLNRICDSRIGRYLEGPVAQDYQLRDHQKEQFRRRLYELKEKQIEYTLSTLEERKRAVEEAYPYYMRRSHTTQPTPEFIEHSAKVRSFNEKNPLFHEANVLLELEKMLPPDQAKQGRERHRTRAEEWRIFESRRFRAEGYLHAGKLNGGLGVLLLLGQGDGWEEFVRRFCMFWNLGADQVSTATTIMRELCARRDAYRAQHEREIETAFWTGDASSSDLFQPIDEIWEELRARLDKIPTAEQTAAMKRARENVPATRPTDYLVPLASKLQRTASDLRQTQSFSVSSSAEDPASRLTTRTAP